MRILKIQSLPSAKQWQDKDIIMFHACFQLLTDFVEKEDGLTGWSHKDYEPTTTELRRLYDWWQENKETASIDDDIADENLMKLIKLKSYLWT